MRKGVTSAQLAAILISIIAIVLVVAVAYFYLLAVAVPYRPPIEIEYNGEFDDAFLATKGWFYSDFTEQTDCNITSDVLGYNWNSCVYRTRLALNATAEASADSRDYQLCLAYDIDNDVGPDTSIDIDTGAGTASTGKPTDDLSLTSVKLYTHEDDPVLVKDLTDKIDDQQDLDSEEVGPLAGDEYVLCMIWHSKTISPDFTTGDDVARISFELDTDEDVDTGQAVVESL